MLCLPYLVSFAINITPLGASGKNRQCRNQKLQVYKDSRAEDQEYHPLESWT